MDGWEAVPGSVTIAVAIIAYIEVRVTQRVNAALAELEQARAGRRADTSEGEGRS